MGWLFANDFRLSAKYIVIYIALILMSTMLRLDFPISLIQGLVFFYCVVIVLHSDLENNISYFYTLFPQKRYFLIIQKNITILISDLLINAISCFKFGVSDNIITTLLLYWLMGSLFIFFFFQFKVAFASSILQIFVYTIYLMLYFVRKFVSTFEVNIILILIAIIIVNLLNIYLYKSKNFTVGVYGK